MRVHYRESGTMGWFEGRTDNVSKSGLLFCPEHVLEPETTIEGRLVLPAVIAEETPAEVVFQGVVVRTVPGTSEKAPAAVAVALQEDRIVRGQQLVRQFRGKVATKIPSATPASGGA